MATSRMVKCMCQTMLRPSSTSDHCTGRKSRSIQEKSFCLVWVTRSMQLAHFAPIMAPRSSKAFSRLMAGSSGESSGPFVHMHRHSSLTDVVHGMEVCAHYQPTCHTSYAHVVAACFNVCTGDIGPTYMPTTSSCLHAIQRTPPRRQPFIPSKLTSPMARFM